MPSDAGAQAHHRALESLYAAAPVNELFQSRLRIPESGRSVIDFEVEEGLYHAAGAAHGTIYFKMLDDAAFYAANRMITDMFLLPTALHLLPTHPIKAGQDRAEGVGTHGRP